MFFINIGILLPEEILHPGVWYHWLLVKLHWKGDDGSVSERGQFFLQDL